jgi:hypothetical protein
MVKKNDVTRNAKWQKIIKILWVGDKEKVKATIWITYSNQKCWSTEGKNDRGKKK